MAYFQSLFENWDIILMQFNLLSSRQQLQLLFEVSG